MMALPLQRLPQGLLTPRNETTIVLVTPFHGPGGIIDTYISGSVISVML